MSYLNTPGIEKLFPQEDLDQPIIDVRQTDPPQGSYLVVPIKMYDPLDAWTDFPRDKEEIAKNRDWVLQDEDKRWAPGPGDYSPYKEGFKHDHIQSLYEQLRKSEGIKSSVWVQFAIAELERTGACRAIPSGFPSGFQFGADQDTLYVGLPQV